MSYRPYSKHRVADARDRLLLNVREEDRGYVTKCLTWYGKDKDDYGYGRIKHRGRYVSVHWILIGDIKRDYRPPYGYEVDHKCLNKSCVRPSHLEYVTRQENLRRRDASKVPGPRKVPEN